MIRTAFLCLALLALALPAHAAEPKLTPPAQFVQKLGDTALISLVGKDLPRTTREKRMRDLLRTNFDIPVIGRSALGPYWREATDKQKSDYMKLFEDMIVRTYTNRFEDYSGQTFKVDGSSAPEGGKDAIVSSKIFQKDGPPVNVEWRVRGADSFKIVDVLVEGVSMGVTQRSDFVAVIQSGGGKVDTLIDTLRQRIATSKK